MDETTEGRIRTGPRGILIAVNLPGIGIYRGVTFPEQRHQQRVQQIGQHAYNCWKLIWNFGIRWPISVMAASGLLRAVGL